MTELEIWEAVEDSLKGMWYQLHAEDKPGLTIQQQGERSAYNTGIFRTIEAFRAFVTVNKSHAERRAKK